MNNNFTKKDLKPGMLVERRDGERRIIMETNKGELFFITDFEWMSGHDMADDLTHKSKYFKAFDIVKVWDLPKGGSSFNDLFQDRYRKLLFERVEDNGKEMTIEEIEQTLGYSVKIVKEHRNGKGN